MSSSSNNAIDLQVIITEASRIFRDVSKSGKPVTPSIDFENMARMPAIVEGSVVLRSPSRSHKVMVEQPLHHPNKEPPL